MRTFPIILITLLVCSFAVFSEDVKPGKESSAIHNSLEVHGHWRIEVQEADGTTVSVTEFENDLVSSIPLSHMLGLENSSFGSYGGWMVYLQDTANVMCDGQGCTLCQNANNCGNPWTINSTNLTVSTVYSSGSFYTVQLSGTVAVINTTTVNNVQTYVKICADNVLPSNCLTSSSDCNFYQLTRANVPSPPSVQAGQHVLVTVDISFS